MRTAEELRAAGKSEAYISAYEAADTKLQRDSEPWPPAEFAGPPLPQPPQIGSPAWEAQQKAAAALKQDEALETLRKREQPRTEPFDAAADERRKWALTQAINNAPAERFGPSPGMTGLMLGGRLMLAEQKNGTIARLAPGVIERRTILPHEWDDLDRAWRAQQRQHENELLSREYGAETCVREGLFTADEAAQLDPERSRHVELPRGLEGM